MGSLDVPIEGKGGVGQLDEEENIGRAGLARVVEVGPEGEKFDIRLGHGVVVEVDGILKIGFIASDATLVDPRVRADQEDLVPAGRLVRRRPACLWLWETIQLL